MVSENEFKRESLFKCESLGNCSSNCKHAQINICFGNVSHYLYRQVSGSKLPQSSSGPLAGDPAVQPSSVMDVALEDA